LAFNPLLRCERMWVPLGVCWHGGLEGEQETATLLYTSLLPIRCAFLTVHTMIFHEVLAEFLAGDKNYG